MATSRGNVNAMADYILGQDHEYEECLRNVRRSKKDDPNANRSMLRKYAEDSIWYIAFRARYGAKEAKKATTELLDEL